MTGYGQCCDTNATCGAGLVCDPVQRVCTTTCTANSDCPFQSPLYGVAGCNINSAPAPYFCNADSAFGWSFAAFCKVSVCVGVLGGCVFVSVRIHPAFAVLQVCRSGSWLGNAGPHLPQGTSQRFYDLITGLVSTFCNLNTFFLNKCVLLCGYSRCFVSRLV